MQCVNYSLNNLYIGLFSLKRAPSSLKYCLHTSYLTKTQDTEVHKYFSYRTELINKRSLLFSAICVWRQHFCSFYQLFIGCHKLSWLVVIQRQVLSFEQGIHVYVVTSGRGFTGVLEAQLLTQTLTQDKTKSYYNLSRFHIKVHWVCSWQRDKGYFVYCNPAEKD